MRKLIDLIIIFGSTKQSQTKGKIIIDQTDELLDYCAKFCSRVSNKRRVLLITAESTNLSGELFAFSLCVNWFILLVMLRGDEPLDVIIFLLEFCVDNDSNRLIACCTRGMVALTIN
jgi:hypothetical protein